MERIIPGIAVAAEIIPQPSAYCKALCSSVVLNCCWAADRKNMDRAKQTTPTEQRKHTQNVKQERVYLCWDRGGALGSLGSTSAANSSGVFAFLSV